MAKKGNLAWSSGEYIAINVAMVPATSIVDWTIEFNLKPLSNEGDALATSSTADGSVVITNAATGTFTVYLTSAKTRQVPHTYRYDIARVDAGSEAVLRKGLVVVDPSPSLGG